jgi:hypothetical protein
MKIKTRLARPAAYILFFRTQNVLFARGAWVGRHPTPHLPAPMKHPGQICSPSNRQATHLIPRRMHQKDPDQSHRFIDSSAAQVRHTISTRERAAIGQQRRALPAGCGHCLRSAWLPCSLARFGEIVIMRVRQAAQHAAKSALRPAERALQ